MGKSYSFSMPSILEQSSKFTKELMQAQIERYIDPPSERPYKWRFDHQDELENIEYRTEHISVVRQFWTPPEKERDEAQGAWGSMFFWKFVKPERLDENNSRVCYDTTDWEYPKTCKTWKTLESAKEYIDHQLALDARKEALQPFVDFLKKMPCTCGEYGSVNDREYLYYAAELADLKTKE